MEAEARRLQKKGEKTQLFKIMEDRGRDRPTSGVWERALKHGDPVAEHLIKRATKASGGLSAAINLLDPEAVVIGGGMGTRFGEEYMPYIKKSMQPYLFDPENPPPILLATLGDPAARSAPPCSPRASRSRRILNPISRITLPAAGGDHPRRQVAVTTELEPITQRPPISTPPVTTQLTPNQQLSPIRTGPFGSKPAR